MRIKGDIRPPGDKSITHRSLIIGSLAHGETLIIRPLRSKDILSTVNAVQRLGIDVNTNNEEIWKVHGGRTREPDDVIDAGNSGTTARLITGVLASIEGVSIITGDSSLKKRPMARIIEPLTLMGASIMARGGRFLPLAVKGNRLKGVSYSTKVASAQVKSAILLAGLAAEGITEVIEPAKSRDHTERMLTYLGASLKIDGNRVVLKGQQRLSGREIHIPSDPSSSAFPAVWAAATDGSELIIRDICINPTRIGFIDVLKRMGADIKIVNTRYSSGEKIGDMVVKGRRLRSTVMEGVEIPGIIDEIPILSVAAAFADGETIIRDAGELRVKETDRIAAVVEGLKALGGNVDAMEEGMIIKGPMRLHSGNVKTFGDHRIAMAFYILSKVADIDINLDDMECVDVSYPGFFKAMEALSD